MTRLATSFCFFALACSEQAFHTVDSNLGGDGPAIEVDPTYINFGEAGDGEYVVDEFVIRSVGESDLEVSGIEISGTGSNSFAILTEELNLVLPPGTEEIIEVAFSPMGANNQTANAIVSSDGEPTKVPVELLGAGSVPELQISPDPLDYGVAYIGCDEVNEVTLTNVGTDTLTISAIDYAASDFVLTEDYALPIVLEPDEYTILEMTFMPSDAIEFDATLTVTSNEPMGERTAAQTGEGVWSAEYTDSWEIPEEPSSDIIFSVDQSCSMDDNISQLANNFSTFITELADYSTDWQIIVANADNGCNNSGILTPGLANYESHFSSAIQSGGGGWYTEALLTIGKNAVVATDSGECNDGLIRENSMLHIIVVSDEPEQSTDWGGLSWSDNVNAIVAQKGSSSDVRISAIVGDYPTGCATAEAGTGYYEAVSATGGVFLSICSDWASPSNLALLAEASVNQNTFELTYTPVVSTITVYVNGAEVSNWTYNAADNTVIFDDGYEPAEGDLVDIDYAGETTCD